MERLAELWIPIVVSAVAVFIASSIIWMALPIHKNDYRKLPDEPQIMQAVRSQGLTNGLYMFPFCKSAQDMKDPAVMARYKEGPWGALLIGAGPHNMGRSLSLWLAHLLVIGVFVAYLTAVALPSGAPFARVFQVAGTTAVLAYAGGWAQKTIWEGFTFSHAAKALFDGVVYGLVTGAVFAWLWPHAPGLPLH